MFATPLRGASAIPMNPSGVSRNDQGGDAPQDEARGSSRTARFAVLLVEERAWLREALTHALEKADRRLSIMPIRSTTDLPGLRRPAGATVILLSLTHTEAGAGLAGRVATVRSAMPDTPMVVLSERADAAEVVEAIACGVSGYLVPSLEGRQVALALRFVATGGTFVPAELLLKGLGDVLEAQPSPAARSLPHNEPTREASGSLTAREASVLRLLRDGLSNKQIARALDVREPTVKVHVHNVLQKLGASNRTQLALLAERMASADAGESALSTPPHHNEE